MSSDISNYNPGSSYFDIFALDIYSGNTQAKYNLALTAAGGKPIAIGECSVLPTPSQLSSQPNWTYFMGWAELVFQNNSTAQIQATYYDSQVVTLNEMPGWHASSSGSISTTAWYSLVNQNSGKCVDARASGTANGTAIQQYTCNNTLAQQFQFSPTSGGYYRLANRNASSQVVDVSGRQSATGNGALLQLWSNNGQTNQQWLPVSQGNGYYHFVAMHSGRCMDVPAASTADSVQLQQYDCNGTNAQSFRLMQQP